MMKKRRRPLAAEQPSEANLASSRGQQVHAAHDEIDALLPIVHRDRVLIRPVAKSIPYEHVTALFVEAERKSQRFAAYIRGLIALTLVIALLFGRPESVPLILSIMPR